MRHAVLALALLATATVPRTALAQSPKSIDIDRSSSDRADELVKRANQHALKDRWSDAEPLYREAWGLKRAYDIAGNLGIAEAALGKNRDAAEHLDFALRSFPTNGKKEHRDLVAATFTKVRAQVGMLNVSVSVAKADVTVDGRSVGIAPLSAPVFVDPGQHVIVATLEGHRAAEQRVDARKGQSQDVALTLQPAGASNPAGASAGPRKPLIIAGAALGGAGLVAGIVLSALSGAKASDASAAQEKHNSAATACGSPPPASGPCADLWSARRAQAALGNAAAWSFIGAGALGAGTLIYALAAPRAANGSAVRAVPLVAASGGGVLLVGEW